MGYIYETLEFMKKLETDYQGLQGTISNLNEQLQKLSFNEMIQLFHPFHTAGIFKKKIGRSGFRLIAQEIRANEIEEPILCLIDIFTRNSREYKSFEKEVERRGVEIRDNLKNRILNSNDFKYFIEMIKQVDDDDDNRLPDDYYQILSIGSQAIDKEGEIICESRYWFESTKVYVISKNLEDIYSIIYKLIIDKVIDDFIIKLRGIRENHNNNHNRYVYEISDSNNVHILFEKLHTEREIGKKLEKFVVWLLHDCNKGEINPKNLEDILRNNNIEVAENTQEIYEIQIGHENMDDIFSKSWRAYPSFMLYDKNIWKDMEKGQSREANLALSGEEEEILINSVPPLFVNGQAGSGKSTMLYFYFAHYFCETSKYPKLPPPVFITYSNDLLIVAKETVKNIFENHGKYAGKSVNENWGNCFSTFDTLVKDDTGEYIHLRFNEFREEYLKRRDTHKLSPEIVWYIIRTYIKGYNLNEIMDPLSYLNLDDDDKTVDEEIFKCVYHRHWPWYQDLCRKNNYYDTIDFVKKELENENLPEYSAIFCDEAQDFTRIELYFILRLSPFTRYSLSRMYLHKFPFFFAGDPLQSINPSGFRWERIKSTFHSTLKELKIPNLRMSHLELLKNYRSTTPLVLNANTIQLSRSVLLQKNIKPQEPWSENYNADEPDVRGAKLFILDDNINYDEIPDEVHDAIISSHVLQAKTQNTLFIIPSEDGAGEHYEEIEDNIREVKEGNPIVTTFDIKGSDHDRTIVYGFGHYFSETSFFNKYSILDCIRFIRYLNSHNRNIDMSLKRQVGITQNNKINILQTIKSLNEFIKSNSHFDHGINNQNLSQETRNLLGKFNRGSLTSAEKHKLNRLLLEDAYPKLIEKGDMSGDLKSYLGENDESKKFKLGYFLNKLYVAMTRARTHLFIIDNYDGYKNLWKYYMETDWMPESLGNEVKREKWEGMIAPIEWGCQADLGRMKEENPLVLAKELEETGIKNRNSKVLFEAAEIYRRINRQKDCDRCLAMAYEIREDWEKAGDIWMSDVLKEYEKAVKCYWDTHAWNKIIGSSLFTIGSILEWNTLLKSITKHGDTHKKQIWDFLNTQCQDKIKNCSLEKVIDKSIKESVINGFNQILRRNDFYNDKVFSGLRLGEEGRQILNNMKLNSINKDELARFNRLIFESIYPKEIQSLIKKIDRYYLKDEYYNVSSFMSDPGISNLHYLFTFFNSAMLDGWFPLKKSSQYHDVYKKLKDIRSHVEEHDTQNHRNIARIFIGFGNGGYQDAYDMAAYHFYMAKEFAASAECWEKAGKMSHSKYYNAKAESAKTIVEKFGWLNKDSQYDRVIKEFEALAEYDDKVIDSVIETYFNSKPDNYVESVINLLINSNNLERAQEELKKEIENITKEQPLSPDTHVSLLSNILDRFLEVNNHDNISTWYEATKIFSDFRPLLKPAYEKRFELRCKIVRMFGRSSAYINPWQEEESKFIRGELLAPYMYNPKNPKPYYQSPSKWLQYVPAEVLGSAIERSGALWTSLDYYEDIMNWKNDKITLSAYNKYYGSSKGIDELIDLARKRWIKCKLRLANFHENQSKDPDARKTPYENLEFSQKSRNEAQIKANKWGFDMNMPDFPDLTNISDPIGKKLQFDGNIKMQESENGIWLGRCNGMDIKVFGEYRICYIEKRGMPSLTIDVNSTTISPDSVCTNKRSTRKEVSFSTKSPFNVNGTVKKNSLKIEIGKQKLNIIFPDN